MYGFLRLNKCNLEALERDAYGRLYCGQCAALQKHFGYAWRAAVSYDAAFLGLLIAAQQETEPEKNKAWCGMFPKRMGVCKADQTAMEFSSAFAIALHGMRLQDARQECETFIRRARLKASNKAYEKALKFLGSIGFPVGLFSETVEAQAHIEDCAGMALVEYAEPTARFLAEVFRFTAKLTNIPQNEHVLYEMGYHTGRLIYFADSCIDLLNDMERKEFNALLASFGIKGITSSVAASEKITALARKSLGRIRQNSEKLELRRWDNLVRNVLLQGLPRTLHHKVTRSQSRLGKSMTLVERYAPHAAFASVLCLFSAQNVEAGWVWKYKYIYNQTAYGFFCAESCVEKKSLGNCMCLDCLFNPFVYFSFPDNSDCWQCFQVPKASISAYGIGRFLWRGKDILEHEKAIARQERNAANTRFLQELLGEIRALENSVNSAAKKGDVPFKANYIQAFELYAKQHSSDRDLETGKFIRVIVADIKDKATDDRKRLEGAFEKCGKVQDKLKSQIRGLAGHEAAIIEFYMKIINTDTKVLLSERRWEDFDKVLDTIAADMKI